MLTEIEKEDIRKRNDKIEQVDEAITEALDGEPRRQILIYDPVGRVHDYNRAGAIRRRVVTKSTYGPWVTVSGKRRFIVDWADLPDGGKLFFFE